MEKRNNQTPKNKQRSLGTPPSEKRKTKYVWLKVLPDELWLKVRQGDTIWEALEKEDLQLKGDCGGLGKCGKCKVRVLSVIDEPSKDEAKYLDEEEIRQGIRLACRTKIDKDLVIYVGEADPDLEYFQILKTGHRPLLQLDPLVEKRPVTLISDHDEECISDLDCIKLSLGPNYKDMKATLHCLRTLPQALKKTQYQGAAVLHENSLLVWENWEESSGQYGLVFDLGTSTLVGKLVSLLDGSEIAVIPLLNSQIKYGSNVISRLQYVKDRRNGLQQMHNMLIDDLNHIVDRLLEVGGLRPNDIMVAVCAGNTIMQHFLLGISPLGIAEAPFSPVLTDGLVVKSVDIGLRVHPEALIYTMPMKSGYIGGDMISVVLASGAAEQDDEIILGLDLGTNGEIFLGNRKRLMTCSTAAGPAFEGARISHGMIARIGAIESVNFDGKVMHYGNIGNVKPKGICGSGLVDLVSVLLHHGVIDHEGLIQSPNDVVTKEMRSRIISRSGVHHFLVASAEESYDNKPIYLTQKDVRELQVANAAIAAGIKTLMDELSIGIQDINHIYLAGALGNYVNPESAMSIGLIPRVDPEVISSLGNAASTGAAMVLLSKNYWQMANDLSDFIEHIELSSRLDFNEYFVEHIDFPRQGMKFLTFDSRLGLSLPV